MHRYTSHLQQPSTITDNVPPGHRLEAATVERTIYCEIS